MESEAASSSAAQAVAAAVAAATPADANSTGKKGPSGRPLKGPEQKTTPIDVPVPESDNVLQTPALEMENVRKVYDTIADHWSHTRYKAWPRVDAFIAGLPPGSLVADLGCGNGKNVPAIQQARGFAVPSDASEPLVRLTAESFGSTGFVADCLCTPLRGGIFDAAISIAVLHHLSTRPRRVQALREAARLLRPGGQFLVYCWSQEQDAEISRSRHRFDAQDVLVPWKHRAPGVKKQKSRGGKGKGKSGEDAVVDEAPAAAAAATDEAAKESNWQEEFEVQQRYCHVYREGELADLLSDVPELEVVEIYFDTGNWCAITRKLPE